MARPLAVLLVTIAASLVALPAAAQWKWRDKGGHVQYSDLPPPLGTPEPDILARPGTQQRRGMTALPGPAPIAAPAEAVSAAASSPVKARPGDPELEAKRGKAEAEQAAKTKVEEQRVAAARADNCTRAKSQMATLESGIRIARSNAKGEREFLDDKQRADETRRARELIAADCR